MSGSRGGGATRTGSDRVPVIDLVRLVSLLLVLAVHLSATGVVRAPVGSLGRRLWLVASHNGSYGVTLFFVVSGLVITRTILRRQKNPGDIDIRAFYVRRAARILPLLVLAVSLGWLLSTLVAPGPARAYCLADPRARFDTGFWLSLPTLSFNWLRIAREAESYGFGLHWDILWSLAIEEQFYILYPWVLRWAGTRRRLVRGLLLVVTLGPISRALAGWQRPDSFLLGFTSSFAAFEQIALGALLCLLLDAWEAHPPRRAGWLLGPALGVLGATGVIAVYCLTDLNRSTDRTLGPTLIAVSVCAFLLAGIRRSWCARLPALTYPGQLSYGGYLFHPAVLLALWSLLAGRPAGLALAVFAVAVFSVAGASYRLFEKPVNSAFRRRLRAE